ncbi:MAG: class I SAM-dependent DNA methyltransferase [Candidatus Thorarchaeota archaeon]
MQSQIDKEISKELWINQCYLILIANLILRSYLMNLKKIYSDPQGYLERILIDFQLNDNELLPFMRWKSLPEGITIVKNLENEGLNILNDITIWEIEEDLFGELYEKLIKKTSRHERGEFYTPDWLALAIINETWKRWEIALKHKRENKSPQFLDPACGSGTFIVNLVKYYYKIRKSESTTANYLIISGFDINPVAVYISRINYILSIPPNVLFNVLEKRPRFYLEIVVRDSLEAQLLPKLNDKGHLRNNFDIVVGNPPWTVLRSIRDKKHQDHLKKQFLDFGLATSTDVHLFTQLDLSTLFFVKCSEFFLNEGGKLAFIMPKSVLTGAKQHEKFKTFDKPQMRIDKIWDLQEISPLFQMPACVLFATKGKKTRYPVQMNIWNGNIPNNGVTFGNYRSKISIREAKYSPPSSRTKKSRYYDLFKVGLSIFPRNFYFVDIRGRNGPFVKIETDPEINSLSKPRWKDIFLRGLTSNAYLFVTLLSWEMFNFGYNRLRWVVLPLSNKIDEGSSYKPLTLDELKGRDKNTYDWFAQAEKTWNQLSTEKSKIRFPSLLARLNYNNLISYQSPDRRYVVAYSGTGTNLTSCVIDKKNLKLIGISNPPQFIADVKTWFFETNESSEAHYLCAVFNSNVLNQLIKPLQPQGLGGGRAIHRRPLSFPIPQFNPSDSLHCDLAEFSRIAHERFSDLTFQKNGTMRREARLQISDILPDLDQQVTNLLARL